MLLLHGMLTPWQIWEEAIDHFSPDYYVIVPELDAHTEEAPSRFESIEREAQTIEDYLLSQCGGKADVLCGLSMGGMIAAVLCGRGKIPFRAVVLDGAPLIRLPKPAKSLMKHSYKTIIRKSQQRDPKVLESARRDFLPEKYLPAFLKIADLMTEDSIDHMIDTVFSGCDLHPAEGTRLLFLHGTKGNEYAARKSARRLKSVYPSTEVQCFPGYAHAQLAVFEPERWSSVVEAFLQEDEQKKNEPSPL